MIDVEERSRCSTLLIADHSGGRVPVMDVKERYSFCMLLSANH